MAIQGQNLAQENMRRAGIRTGLPVQNQENPRKHCTNHGGSRTPAFSRYVLGKSQQPHPVGEGVF